MVRPQDSERISKINTYLNCAEVFAYRSTCIKRKYGAVIVKDDVVISTGYNGAPRGMENCCDIGKCPRIERNLHQGDGYAMCRAIHAEANALYNALYNGSCVNGSTIYVHGLPCCIECAKAIIQSGIKRVVYDSKPKPNWEDSTAKALELFKEAGVEVQYIEQSQERK